MTVMTLVTLMTLMTVVTLKTVQTVDVRGEESPLSYRTVGKVGNDPSPAGTMSASV